VNSLCLLAIHAHPDDEASKGAPTVARYRQEGVRAVLVCCTGGEEGDLQNPKLAEAGGPFFGLDPVQTKAMLAELRPRELDESVRAIGYTDLELLGYRDSGMADTEPNQHPQSFNMAPLDESTGRLVKLIRHYQPQVLLTYPDDQQGYPHPDHLRVHDISMLAFDRAGDPSWYPEAGEPWQPSKLYYSVWSRARMEAWHAMFEEMGMESPYGEDWFKRPNHDDRITTRIPITVEQWRVRNQALRAHATQVNPEGPFWFGLPDDRQAAAYPFEDWILARSLVGMPAEGTMEDDLFAGVRLAVRQ
jgi:mycothiol S-conjugate amidase